MRVEDVQVTSGFIIEEKVAVYTEHEFHMHYALEISIALDGTMKYPMGDRWYYADPGDVFLLRPFEPHWNLTREPGQPGRWIMLLFSPDYAASLPHAQNLLVPFYTTHAPQVIPAASPYAALIRRMALEALQESREAKPGWELQQMTLLVQILIAICRYYDSLAANERSGTSELPGIVAAVEHLIASWSRDIDMDALIARTGMRKTRFYAKFKEVTGLTPHEFVTRLRLQHAAHLLLHSRQTITEIALDCGFGSSSYFNKVFKDYREETPGDYRKRMQTAEP